MKVDQRVQPQPSMSKQRGLNHDANGMAEAGIRSGTAEGTNSNTQMTPQAAGAQGSTYPPNYPPGAYAPPPNRPSSSGPCCGCMPLKTACIVIGIINLVPIVIAMGTSAVALLVLQGTLLSSSFLSAYSYVGEVWILLFLWAIGYGLVNVGLIVGASKGNGCMCWTWIAVTGISVFSFFIGNIWIHWSLGYVKIGGNMIPYFLQVYFIVVVVFYAKELKENRLNRQQGQGFMAPQGQPSQPMMSQQYGPYSGNGNAMIVPGTQTQYYGGNPGNYPSTFGPPPPYQTLAPQPLMQNSDGVDLNAGPGQPYPASLASQMEFLFM